MDNNEKDDFDLQGRLGCFSLSDLLQTLSFTQKTGTLTLIQGWNTRTICYDNGRITYIAAATRLPTIVELLLQTERLTVRQLEQRLGKDWKIKLGVATPVHAEPDSPTPAGVAGEAKTASRNGRAAVTSTSRHLTTDPDLTAEFGDIETFVPPEMSGMNGAHDPAVDPARILLEHKLVMLEPLAWCEEQKMGSRIYTRFLCRNRRHIFR